MLKGLEIIWKCKCQYEWWMMNAKIGRRIPEFQRIVQTKLRKRYSKKSLLISLLRKIIELWGAK